MIEKVRGWFRREPLRLAREEPPRLGSGGLPSLEQIARVPVTGITSGPWHRALGQVAEWLGPYTPDYVETWVKKRIRRDGQIRIGLIAYKAPFFGIEYRLEGSTPEIRAFVRRAFLERPAFEQVLMSTLNALDFGMQAHELLWQIEDVEIDEDGPGGLPPRVLPRVYTLRELLDLDPETVELAIDGRGEIAAVVAAGSTIPAEKAYVATHQPEWRDWWGQAVLDFPYQPWYWCNWLYLYLMRYLEQKGNPPLIGYAPWDSRYNEDVARAGQTAENTLDVLGRMAMALRGGGYVGLPHELDEKGQESWRLEPLQESGRVDQFLPAIQHLQALKLRALLVPERVVTQDTSVGSFAMSETHLDVFFSNMELTKRLLILNSITQGPIAALVRANFGRAAVVPSLKASELSRQSKQLLADILKQTIEIPRTLEDGRVYSIAELVDDLRTLEALNIPHRQPRDVAHARAGGAAPTSRDPAKLEAATEPAPEELARYPEGAATVAERYGASAATIRGWVALGAPCLRLPGGRYRFDGQALHAWLAERAVPAPAKEAA